MMAPSFNPDAARINNQVVLFPQLYQR